MLLLPRPRESSVRARKNRSVPRVRVPNVPILQESASVSPPRRISGSNVRERSMRVRGEIDGKEIAACGPDSSEIDFSGIDD